MKELDRLIRRAGGVLVSMNRHRVYELDGERITLHMGTKVNSQQIASVRALVRRVLKRRQQTKGNADA